jgi:DNA-binding winged helix-turn-helix (wHTH) protein/tetratricopeptide (TPR) repeat protein
MEAPHSYAFGGFRLDVGEGALYHGAERVVLTPKAIDTLIVLVERHGRLVTKDELFRRVWPNAFVEENNLAQNVSQLRRALGEGGSGDAIETVPKRGYRFVARVTEVTDIVASPHVGSDVPRPPEERPGRELDRAPHPPLQPAEAPFPPPAGGWPARRVVWAAIAAAVAVVAVVVASKGRDPGSAATVGSTVSHLTVLPFDNRAPTELEYLAKGLAEDLSSRLGDLPGVAVRTSPARRDGSIERIAADLDVDYVVDGAVGVDSSHRDVVTITSALIRVSDRATIWNDQYAVPLARLPTVREQILRSLTGALSVAGAARGQAAAGAPTVDSDAYLAFLRGIAAYQDGDSDTTNQARARDDLEQAVARDPGFAQAWSWLARTYIAQYRSGAARTSETRDAGFRAARMAISLDGRLAGAHLALAQAHFSDRDYESARAELDLARAGLSTSAEWWEALGRLDEADGRWSQAQENFRRGFELDPHALAQRMTVHYLHLRDYPEARRFVGIARAANQGASVVPEAWLLFSERGEPAAARGVLETALVAKAPADARVRALLARFEWFDGRAERALELIGDMDAAGAWLAPNFRFPADVLAGQVYAQMGRRQDALKRFAAALPPLKAREAALPDDYQVHAALALTYVGLGQRADAVRHAERAVTLLPVTKDAAEAPLYLYLLAQVYAQTGSPDAALETLDRLFAVPGFYNEQWVQRDPGFAPLLSHPAFMARIARWALQRGDVLLRARAVDPGR